MAARVATLAATTTNHWDRFPWVDTRPRKPASARSRLRGVFAIHAVVLILVALASAVSAHPSAEHKAELIGKLIQERPAEQKLYIQRGSAYSDDGLYELALADFKKAETLGDAYVVALHLGVLHYRTQAFAASRGYFDTFLEHFPRHASALEYRARLLRDSQKYRASLADYETLLATQNRPNPGHYVSVATMLAKLDDEGIGPAIEMLDKGIRRLGLIPQLQQYAIELELRRKNIAQAIIRLETLEPMLGASPEWRLEMGETLLLAGRPSDARRHLDEAASQLARLRMTPARQQTLEKLRRLRESLEEPGS